MRVGTALGRHLASNQHEVCLELGKDLRSLLERAEYLDAADVLAAQKHIVVQKPHDHAPVGVIADGTDKLAAEGAVAETGPVDDGTDRSGTVGKMATVKGVEEVADNRSQDARHHKGKDPSAM